MNSRRWTLLCLLALAGVVALPGCTLPYVEVEQESASGLAGELLDGRVFGQTFTPQYDGLHRIDLYTATYARENTHPVIFSIKAAVDAKGDLVRLELPAAEISNSGPTVITFPPLHSTAGKTLYFAVESPGSVPGDAITVYRDEEDVYTGGQMVVDGQPTDGDIAFIAYSYEAFTVIDIWNDFYSRASQDKPFFTFYCSLIGLLLLALIATVVWPSRQDDGRRTKDQGPETIEEFHAPLGKAADESGRANAGPSPNTQHATRITHHDSTAGRNE